MMWVSLHSTGIMGAVDLGAVYSDVKDLGAEESPVNGSRQRESSEELQM